MNLTKLIFLYHIYNTGIKLIHRYVDYSFQIYNRTNVDISLSDCFILQIYTVYKSDSLLSFIFLSRNV